MKKKIIIISIKAVFPFILKIFGFSCNWSSGVNPQEILRGMNAKILNFNPIISDVGFG